MKNASPAPQIGTIYLTDGRVRQGDGQQALKSALLTEVNAATLDYRTEPVLAVAGLFLGIAGAAVLAAGPVIPGLVLLAFGLVLLLAYLLTRRMTLVIYAGNLRMTSTVPAAPEAMAAAVAFIDKLERMKRSLQAGGGAKASASAQPAGRRSPSRSDDVDKYFT